MPQNQSDPLRELMTTIARSNTPVQVGEQVAPSSEAMIMKLQQLYQQLFGPQAVEGNDLVNDPIGGGPMSRNPLRNRMTGRSFQDPSMGMGY